VKIDDAYIVNINRDKPLWL